ncbi:hypothetical protein [uncultured Stenotrophomonas sp.]|uniref:hypothetical protein n=1 Tax=uncultured Stenotrophomonas sp. TaxID=165438 RepID=UPI0025F127FB|nr:hypothetical protein [uncultured Stenotrophomonas sp.]
MAAGTRDDYESARSVLINYPANLGVPFGKLQAAKLRNYNFHDLIDKIESASTPTKASMVLRYWRLVFRLTLDRGIINHDPVQGLEQAKVHKRRRLLTNAAYASPRSAPCERRGLRARHHPIFGWSWCSLQTARN